MPSVNERKKSMLNIEIACATLEKQQIISLTVPVRTTVKDAILQSGILQQFPDIDLNKNKVGIFSKRVALDTLVCDADRIEIYFPLRIDPKQRRRNKVAR